MQYEAHPCRLKLEIFYKFFDNIMKNKGNIIYSRLNFRNKLIFCDLMDSHRENGLIKSMLNIIGFKERADDEQYLYFEGGANEARELKAIFCRILK